MKNVQVTVEASPLKSENPALQNMNFLSYLWVFACPPGSGSGSAFPTRIRIQPTKIKCGTGFTHCFIETFFRCRSLLSRLVSCAQCAASPRPTPASPAAHATAPSGHLHLHSSSLFGMRIRTTVIISDSHTDADQKPEPRLSPDQNSRNHGLS